MLSVSTLTHPPTKARDGLTFFFAKSPEAPKTTIKVFDSRACSDEPPLEGISPVVLFDIITVERDGDGVLRDWERWRRSKRRTKADFVRLGFVARRRGPAFDRG